MFENSKSNYFEIELIHWIKFYECAVVEVYFKMLFTGFFKQLGKIQVKYLFSTIGLLECAYKYRLLISNIIKT